VIVVEHTYRNKEVGKRLVVSELEELAESRLFLGKIFPKILAVLILYSVIIADFHVGRT
jgi:hypothetical protein